MNIESNFEGSTIETSEYGSEELIEQMSSFGIKRHKLIKWGDNIIDTEADGSINQNDKYHKRKKTPLKYKEENNENKKPKTHTKYKKISRIIYPKK